MQKIAFMGRLAADPQITRFGDDKSKVVFRVLENRGKNADGSNRVTGLNCVCWSHGRNEKVIMPGLASGCGVIVEGKIVDQAYEKDGKKRFAKELVVEDLRILDWASDRDERQQAA